MRTERAESRQGREHRAGRVRRARRASRERERSPVCLYSVGWVQGVQGHGSYSSGTGPRIQGHKGLVDRPVRGQHWTWNKRAKRKTKLKETESLKEQTLKLEVAEALG